MSFYPKPISTLNPPSFYPRPASFAPHSIVNPPLFLPAFQFFQNELEKKGSSLLECPITGGLEALKKGQMAVWVAGEKSALESVREILNASYSTVMYTGGLGTAMIPKVKWLW